MSGAPLLDESTLTVCGIMKRTRSEMAIAGGFATAVADVVAMEGDVPRVAQLLKKHQEYLERVGVDAPEEAKVRWGTLPEKVEGIIARTGSLDAFVAALADASAAVDLANLHESEYCGRVARHLFGTDIRMLALLLADLREDGVLTQEDARAVFERVACCLPLSAAWQTDDLERPVAWWIAPQAAEQLREELRAQAPRVAHVPTDERATAAMLVRRAGSRGKLRLHESEPHTDVTPEPTSWLDAVDRVIRDAVPGAKPGWRDDENARNVVVDWVKARELVITLPPIDLGPADVSALRTAFGDLPFVLRCRSLPAALAGSDRVVQIRPDVDVKVEKSAVIYYGNV